MPGAATVKQTGTTRTTAAKSVAAALVIVVVFAVLATQLFGLAWPLLRVLPDGPRFHGASYHKLSSAGCKSLAEWSRIQHTPLGAYRTVGHIGSAVYFFPVPIVTLIKPDPTYHLYQWFLAKDGGCYTYYQGDFGG
jgi:hypothetical protein